MDSRPDNAPRIRRTWRKAMRLFGRWEGLAATDQSEEDHQHPRHFLRSRDAVVREAIDQHPDPEDETRQADQSAEQTQEHPRAGADRRGEGSQR